MELVQKSNCLPAFELSPILKTKCIQGYLQFIIDLYITAYKNSDKLANEVQIWFFEEMAYQAITINPTLTRDDIQALLDTVIKEALEEKQKVIEAKRKAKI